MKQLLITIAALVLLVCGESQQSLSQTEKNIDPFEAGIKNLEDLDKELEDMDFKMPEMPTFTPPEWEFEYTTLFEENTGGKIEDSFIQKINELGKNDWELRHIKSLTNDGNTTGRIYFFQKSKMKTDVMDKELKAEGNPSEPDAEAAKQEPLKANAPDISIHDAIRKGNIELAQKLIANGADINRQDEKGYKPLHIAASKGHEELVKYLISKDVDIDGRAESDDTTPLHQAAGGGHKSVCEILTQNGADINSICKFGSPLDVSIHFNQDETAELLKRLGAKHKNLYFAVRSNDEKSVMELLSNGEDVDSRNNPLENTPLIYASFKGYYNIVKLLIINGADVSMMVNKKTALLAAASKGHLEIVDILIKNDAYINPLSLNYDLGKPETPLDAALGNGFTEVTDLLRKHGGKTGAELKAEGK